VMLVGDLIIWFYEGLAGIKSHHRQAGFKHVVMRPQPLADLQFVEASHRSLYGTIGSHWKIDDGTFHWKITLPVNTTATVHVPTTDPQAVREGDTPAAEAQGVERLGAGNGLAVYRVGSGTYKFSAPYSKP